MKALVLLALVGCSGAKHAAVRGPPPPPPPPPPDGGPEDLKQQQPLLPDLGDDSPTMVSGAIDPAVINRVVRTYHDKLRECYETALLATPGLEGRCVVTFTIEIDGHVVDASASGVDTSVETCLVTIIRKLVFPRPGGKVTVSYPFTFKP